MALKEAPSVAVVCGGPSAEAEVSRTSGRCVAEALQATYANVSLIELNEYIAGAQSDARTDVVFPALHGPPGEDGTFQGFLEMIGVPYVGCGVQASACGMDKVIAKQLFRTRGVPVADEVVVYRSDGVERGVEKIHSQLGEDIVVKPTNQGSALGVVFGDELTDLAGAIEAGFKYDERVLVEKRLYGREITVAILERNGFEALPAIEIVCPPGSWYDFEHRYTPGLSDHVMPAPLPEEQYRRTQEVSVMAFEALGCRDISRVDLVVPEEGEPIVLEVNTMPGMTPTSLYPDAARGAGLSFEQLVAHFIEQAYARSI